MSKKKKKKQQMHVSAGNKQTTAVQGNKAQSQNVTQQKNAAQQKGKEEAIEIKMNFYSAMSMLTTLISAVAVILAMILAGRGFYYVLQTLFDEAVTDLNLLNDNLIEAGFSSNLTKCAYATAGMLVVVVILSLSGTFAAINPKKKPNIVPAVIMVVLSVAAVVAYLVGNAGTQDIVDTFAYVPLSRHIGIYNIQLYVLIANALCSIVNVFGQKYGLKLYKEKGYTC